MELSRIVSYGYDAYTAEASENASGTLDHHPRSVGDKPRYSQLTIQPSTIEQHSR